MSCPDELYKVIVFRETCPSAQDIPWSVVGLYWDSEGCEEQSIGIDYFATWDEAMRCALWFAERIEA